MNYAKILTVLQGEPLFCDNDYRSRLLNMLNEHKTLSKDEFAARSAGTDMCGQEIEVPQASVDGSIGIIPIGGPIGQGLGTFEKGQGCVDVEDIRNELELFAANDVVENVILLLDTPGGMVTGTPELADYIKSYTENTGKPIYAYVSGDCCSGGYYLASGCSGIFTAPTSRIGNVGVYTTFTDLSRMADMQGISVKVFTSGAYKGAGVQGTSLTAQQEIFMQERVMEAAKNFYAHIQGTRPQIKAEDLQGQWYWGSEAESRGFVDGIMPTLADLKAFLS